MPRSILFGVFSILALTACGGSSTVAPTPPAAASPSPTPAATARYRVTFDATWSAQTHPTDIPGNPHFSGLIGGTHRSTVKFWEEGGLATEGIQLMAERGRQTRWTWRSAPRSPRATRAVRAGRRRRAPIPGHGEPRVRRHP